MDPVKRVMRLTSIWFLAASVTAQTPPDFSGRWILAPDPPSTAQRGGAPGTMGTGWGADITVTQDAATLTIEYARFARSDMQPPTRLVYWLNGSESRNSINMGRGPQEQVSKAAWDGSKLVITTVHAFTVSSSRDSAPSAKAPPGDKTAMTSETRYVLWLESPAALAIETTYSGVLGGPPLTTKAVYRKN
jgi:hypothetical protein